MIRLILNVSAKEANGAGVEKQTPGKDRRETSRAKIMAVKSKGWRGGHQGGDKDIFF